MTRALLRVLAKKSMKVFLSHSTKNADVAQTLAHQLNAVGIEPWLCELDVSPGDDFVAEIESGLSDSTLVLLLWSEAASLSAWTGLEWRSVLAREVEESRTRLGILALDATPLPQLLRTKHRLDGDTIPKGIKHAVDWVVAQRDSRRYQASQAAKFVLDFQPTDFVGRAEYFDVLHEALCARSGKYLLWGEPGSGKSLLAIEFAWRSQGGFDTVVFQHCGQRTVESIGVELAEHLGLGVERLSPAQQIDAAQAWLCERRTLLILDDVWTADVGNLLPKPPKSVASLSVLVTSRQQTLPWVDLSQRCQVIPFVLDESLQLYRLCLGVDMVTQHRDALAMLATRFEHLPIAISVSARLLHRQLDPLDQAAGSLVLEQLRGELHDVPDLLQRAISYQSEAAQRLLCAMAVCDADGFWLPLATSIAGLDETAARRERDALVHGSLVQLVDRDRQRFRLHALLREQLLGAMPDTTDWAQRHAAALAAIFSDWEHDWRSAGECLADIIVAMRHLWDMNEPSRMAHLASHAGAAGFRIGELEAAHRILSAEQALWSTRNDERAKQSLQASYGNQAIILQAWGRLDEAMALHKQEEALGIELGETDSLQTSYGNQALILKAWGQLDQAMTLHQKEEALCIKLGDTDGLQRTYGNQAIILRDWGQLDEAMALHKKKAALCIELGNKDGLQRTYGNQALILQDWGQLDEAIALHKKQEALCIELGNKDSLQANYGNQALILQNWGRLDEAMALHKKQEALCIELGNKDDLQTNYGNQALVLQAWEQLDEAMALLEKKEVLCNELGNKRGLQACYGNQALVLQAWGQLDQARALREKQETLCIELGARRDLAYCYWYWGRLAGVREDTVEQREKLTAARDLYASMGMRTQVDSVNQELAASQQ